MGLGSHLPLEVARVVVPRLPRRLQRFVPADSWDAAQRESVGYAALPVSVPHTPVPVPTRQLLEGNRLATVAAFGVAISALGRQAGPLRVLDFGGFDGAHADLITAAFPSVPFDWTVVDLPAVAETMRVRARPGLVFTSSLTEALGSGVDIAYASASINYLAEPVGILDQLLKQSAATVLTRLPLWPISDNRVAVQRAQRRPVEISYPTWFFSEAWFLAYVEARSKLLLDFGCPDDRGSFAGHYAQYRGLVLARKDERESVNS